MIGAHAFQTATLSSPPTTIPTRISAGRRQPHVSSSSGLDAALPSDDSAVAGRRRGGGGARLLLAAVPEVQERQGQDQDLDQHQHQHQRKPSSGVANGGVGDDGASDTKVFLAGDVTSAVDNGEEGRVVAGAAAAADRAPALVAAPPPSQGDDGTDGSALGIWAARGLLLLVAAIWGTNFAVSGILVARFGSCVEQCRILADSPHTFVYILQPAERQVPGGTVLPPAVSPSRVRVRVREVRGGRPREPAPTVEAERARRPGRI